MKLSTNINEVLEKNQFLSQLKVFRNNFSTQITTFLALVGLCIILSFLTPNFLTPANLVSVLQQSTLIMILAIGETFIIITGGIDLSVGAVVAVASATMGQLVVNKGMNPFLGIGLCLLIGIVCGLFHGILITKLGMAPFIVTLGTMTIWRGFAEVFVKGQTIYSLPRVITWLGDGYIGPVPVAVILCVILYTAAWFILKRTKLGVATYAIGGNENAARLSGINIEKTKIIIYMLAGLLCAIGGIVIAGRMNGTSASVATGYELDAIAAVAIGGTSMSGGEGVIWGTLIGAVMMQVIRNGMNMLRVQAYWQMVVLGSVIVAAVAVDCVRRKRKK